MFYQVDKAIFNLHSRSKKARLISEHGTFVGVRERNGRTLNLFMYKSLFLEVTYVGDNSGNAIESISLIGNISRLNSHLEREFKSVFSRPTFSRGLSA